jgi:hypothetical protein
MTTPPLAATYAHTAPGHRPRFEQHQGSEMRVARDSCFVAPVRARETTSPTERSSSVSIREEAR